MALADKMYEPFEYDKNQNSNLVPYLCALVRVEKESSLVNFAKQDTELSVLLITNTGALAIFEI